jgi:hypothetical protein
MPISQPRVQEILRQADSETRVRARAVKDLLAYDFSQAHGIVAMRESDLSDRLNPRSPLGFESAWIAPPGTL